MNHIERIFGKPRVLLPVIHVQSGEHAAHNAKVAMDNGADGVWLINQGASSKITLQAAQNIASANPTWWVGVNLLGEDDLEVIRQVRTTVLGTKIMGVWSDNADVSYGFDPNCDSQESWYQGLADACAAVEKNRALQSAKFSWSGDPRKLHGDWRSCRSGLYFGGVAFKYQRKVHQDDLEGLTKLAVLGGVDVVTTSGDATGMAAAPKKLAIMREALGDHALALASGISEENIDQYPMVNAFIVASSILLPDPGENFDPTKVRRLADRISAF